nr:MAG TPA: Baseplate wedge protein [Caudoviricetes sp.]
MDNLELYEDYGSITEFKDDGYGVTQYGFRRKLYNECLSERITRAREVFGVKIDTSETSFLGKLIRNAAWDEAYMWEIAESVYMSPFVNYAEGTGLDAVGQYLTITRRPAAKSKGVITVYGTKDTLVPAGFRVATPSGIEFLTTEFAYIGNDGRVDIPIESVIAGNNTNAQAEEINQIVNPTFGIDRVMNAMYTEGGMDVETDEEFRLRYKKSYSRVGGSTVPAMTAAILDIDDVVDCEVRENVTMEEVDGIPPKSVACFVFGGSDDDITNTIYNNKPAGIEAFGDTYKYIEDKKGIKHKIGFTRAKEVKIKVNISLTKTEDYPGDNVIKRAVLGYIGGVDDDNVEYAGLKLGEDVIYNKLIAKVLCPGGVADAKVSIGASPDFNMVKETITLDKNSIAVTSFDQIRIDYE